MECMSIYEQISGAKVNLEKSTLVQLDSEPRPEWFSIAGCQIAEDLQVLKYLGCPFGRHITPRQEIDFVLQELPRYHS
jgi:hypothetical protein